MTQVRLSQEPEFDPAPRWVLTRGLALQVGALVAGMVIVSTIGAGATLPWLLGGWLLWVAVFVILGLRAWLGRNPRAYRPLTVMAGGDALWVAVACVLSLAGPGAPWGALAMLALWALTLVWHVRAANDIPLEPLARKLSRTGLLTRTSDEEVEWRGFHVWRTSPDFDKSDQMQKVMNYYAPTAIAFVGLALCVIALIAGNIEAGLALLGVLFFGVALGMNETTRLTVISWRLIGALERGKVKI